MKKKTPQYMSPELYSKKDILSMQIIRKDVYRDILDTIDNLSAGNAPQHLFISGQKGSGKTFLLTRLLNERMTAGKIQFMNFRYVLPESLAQLCTEMERGTYGHNSVLLADNFDNLIMNTERIEHFRLRKKLSSPDSPLIIASGRTIPAQLLNYDEAFYDSFRLLHLQDISKNENMELTISICPYATESADAVEKTFEAIGGTPEIAVRTANQLFMGRKSGKDIIEGILEESTSYYEAVIGNLPAPSRAITIALLESGESCNLKELHNITGFQNNVLTSNLCRLKKQDIIYSTTPAAKKSRYHISDARMKKWAESFLKRQ